MQFLRSFLLLSFCLCLFGACNSSGDQKNPSSAPDPTNDVPAQPGQYTAQTFRGLEIRPINFPGRTFMGIRKKVPMNEIQGFYAKNLGNVFRACQSAGLQMDGMPSGLFFEFNEEAKYIDMAATIGVKQGANLGEGIKTITLPAAKALMVDYYGSYGGISKAHYAMDDYMSTYKITQNRGIPVIEEYVTDPGAEPDPNKRLTRLIYFY